MKLNQSEKDNLIRIAYWYYTLHMTQSEIAQRLGMTRQKVNQIIGDLVDMGIVRIEINGLTQDNAELECAIEYHFHLARVLIVDTGEDSEKKFDVFCLKAAEFISSLLRGNQTIGLSWGRTLGRTASLMSPKPIHKSTIIQLVGGLNSNSTLVHPDEIARTMAEKLQCSCRLLYAPAFVENPAARNVILQEGSVRDAFDDMRRCDIALLGVGELGKRSTLNQEGFMPPEILTALIDDGCVGDIAMRPFRRDGTWGECDNIIGISPATIATIPNVVILACGIEKAEAVIGALNTHCVNTVVIDKAIAGSIAEQFNLKAHVQKNNFR